MPELESVAWDNLQGVSGPEEYWTTGNIGEALPGVMTPLSWSLWAPAIEAGTRGAFHALGAHYLNADTTAFMQFIEGDLFRDFPSLRFIIPHGGGAVPYHWGRYRGLAQVLRKPLLREHILKNVFFDTCVYHQPRVFHGNVGFYTTFPKCGFVLV